MKEKVAYSLVIAGCLFDSGLCLFSLTASLFSVMIFDSGPVHFNIPAIVFFLSLWTMPFVCVGAIVLSWRNWNLRNFLFAVAATALPLVNVFAMLSMYFVIETFYDGRLT